MLHHAREPLLGRLLVRHLEVRHLAQREPLELLPVDEPILIPVQERLVEKLLVVRVDVPLLHLVLPAPHRVPDSPDDPLLAQLPRSFVRGELVVLDVVWKRGQGHQSLLPSEIEPINPLALLQERRRLLLLHARQRENMGRVRPVDEVQKHPDLKGLVDDRGPAKNNQLHVGRVEERVKQCSPSLPSVHHLGNEVVDLVDHYARSLHVLPLDLRPADLLRGGPVRGNPRYTLRQTPSTLGYLALEVRLKRRWQHDKHVPSAHGLSSSNRSTRFPRAQPVVQKKTPIRRVLEEATDHLLVALQREILVIDQIARLFQVLADPGLEPHLPRINKHRFYIFHTIMPSDDTATMLLIENSILTQKEINNKKVIEDQTKGLNIIKNIIRRKELMLHGGLAVNALLPKSKKFYDETTIPDYDAMIADNTGKITKKIMYEAQNKLSAADYTAHFHPAIHGNTQKLRSHPKGITRLEALRYPNIFDATSIPKKDFDTLKALSDKEKKLLPADLKSFTLVPLAWMKLSMHLEFSRPSVHIGRWSKLFPRCTRLYEAYPTILRSGRSAFKPEVHDKAPINILLEDNKEDTFVVGEYAALKIMGKPEGGRPAAVVKDLSKAHDLLYDAKMDPGEIVPESTFLPEHFRVGDSTVYSWEECSAVVEDGLFGNSDTILRYLYGEFIQYGTTSVIDDLVKFQIAQTSSDISKGLGTRFSTVCK